MEVVIALDAVCCSALLLLGHSWAPNISLDSKDCIVLCVFHALMGQLIFLKLHSEARIYI